MSPHALIERIVASPPRRLSELEALTGTLAVDFAGTEGFGHFDRCADRSLASDVRIHHPLIHGLSTLWVSFFFDDHHDDPHSARDVTFESVRYGLDISTADARAILARHGPGRPVTAERGESALEYRALDGAFFYVHLDRDDALLEWRHARPEWAHPRVPDDTRIAFLGHLVEAATHETTDAGILRRIAPSASAAGATITSRPAVAAKGQSSGVMVIFQPALAIAMVAEAFGWTSPVATSGDVHMSSWFLGPLAEMTAPPGRPSLGAWFVDVELEDWPWGAGGRELPTLESGGASETYDARECVTGVRSVGFSPRGSAS